MRTACACMLYEKCGGTDTDLSRFSAQTNAIIAWIKIGYKLTTGFVI